MARIRTVKPEMAQDEDLASTSIEAQLLAVRILNHSDDEGYFKANPALVKANCFPLIDSLNVHALLTELCEIGYLRVFTGADGKLYGLVVNFTDHQKINRPTPSKIKGIGVLSEDSVSGQGGLTIGKERKGKEQGKERNIYSSGDERFDEWYAEFPRKQGKTPARKTWKREKLDTVADHIIADTRIRTQRDWANTEKTHIPMASTYLNQRRWEDEDYADARPSTDGQAPRETPFERSSRLAREALEEAERAISS